MLNCVHHVQWVRAVEGGLHQCIQCQAVVGKKDVYPKLEDLPAEFRARWDAHEASARPAPSVAPAHDVAPARTNGASAPAIGIPAAPPRAPAASPTAPPPSPGGHPPTG